MHCIHTRIHTSIHTCIHFPSHLQVRPGEELCISYVDIAAPREERRHLV